MADAERANVAVAAHATLMFMSALACGTEALKTLSAPWCMWAWAIYSPPAERRFSVMRPMSSMPAARRSSIASITVPQSTS